MSTSTTRRSRSIPRGSTLTAKVNSGSGPIDPKGLWPRVNVELVRDFAENPSTAASKHYLVRIHLDLPMNKQNWDAVGRDLAERKFADAGRKLKDAMPRGGNQKEEKVADNVIDAACQDR